MSIGHFEALIIDRLIEAQIVMKQTSARGVRPSTTTTFWPETETSLEERWEVVKEQLIKGIRTDDPLRSRQPRPSAAAVSRMEETWQWMAGIKDEDARKALAVKVWGWVYEVSSSDIAKAMKIDRRTLNRRFNKAIELLIIKLCKEKCFPAEADESLVSRFRPDQAIKNRNIATNAA